MDAGVSWLLAAEWSYLSVVADYDLEYWSADVMEASGSDCVCDYGADSSAVGLEAS